MFNNLFDEDGTQDNINDDGFIGPLLNNAYGSGSNGNNNRYQRKPTAERSGHGFVGLLNQGATCYLNSLIQMLYMTPELKNEIYKLGIDDFGISDLKDQKNNSSNNNSNSNKNEINENVNNNETQSITTTTTTTTTANNNNIENNNNVDSNNSNSNNNNNDMAVDSNNNSNSNEFNYKVEDDHDLLNSEYAINILSFGFEDYKVVAGLKRFPSPDQQERLIDWILNYDESSTMYSSSSNNNVNNNNNSNNSNNNKASNNIDEIPFGPVQDNDASYLNRSLFDDCFDAFDMGGNNNNNNSMENVDTYPRRDGTTTNFYNSIHGIDTTTTTTTTTNSNNNSKAIVLYDETNTINIFSGEAKATKDTITNSYIADASAAPTTTTTTTTTNNATTNTTTTTTTKKKGRIIPYELQRLFSMLQKGNVYAISTEDLTKSFGWTSDQSFHQQDVHELNRILFDAVEHSIKKTPIESLFNNLYKGYFVNRLTCTKCGTIKDSEEHFQDIPIGVKGFNSIEESLAGSFSTPETLDGNNKYSCDKCNEKVVATFQVKLGKVPPILIFALRRFDYDFQRGVRVKLHNHFEFSQQLDMTPYTIDYLQHKENPETVPAPPKLNYELFSVLIHSGGAFGGHYHSYIKDLQSVGKSILDDKKDEENQASSSSPTVEDSTKETTTTTTTTTTTNTATDASTNNDTTIIKNDGNENSDEDGNKYTGWFDFNDSSVLPIKDNILKKQFGGANECAYMLIYREVGLREKMEYCDIPAHFEKEISDFNKNISAERVEYEKTLNTFNIVPRFDDSIIVRGGVIYDLNFSLRQDKESMQVDVSCTTENLLKKIREKYAQKISEIEEETKQPVVIQEVYVKDLRIVLQPPLQPSNFLVKKVGLNEGSQILIWAGEDKSNVPINVNVKYFYSKSEAINNIEQGEASFDDIAQQVVKPMDEQTGLYVDYSIKDFNNLLVDRKSTFQEFKHVIVNEINNQFKCKVESNRLLIYRYVSQTSLLPLEDDMDLNILDRIYDGISLYCELLPEGFSIDAIGGADNLDAASSLVKKDFELNKAKIQIFVKDRFRSSVIEPPPVRILSDPKNTIYQLKSIIFDNLYPNQKKQWIDQTVIRKTLVGGYEGTTITDDTLLLKEANIVDTSLIIFEKGQPTKSNLTIKYIYAIDKKPANSGEPKMITCLKTTTIQQLKQNILTQLSISSELSSRYILRQTDLFEKPINIIVEEDMTLEEIGIKSMEILWIEEGVLPLKDQIQIKVRLYQMNNVSQILPIPSSPILHLNPTFIPTIPDLFTIINIGDIWVDKKLTLLQLKNQFLNWDLFLNQTFINKEEQDIRIWLDEKLLNSFNKPLSKLHIQLDSIISIEIFTKDVEATAFIKKESDESGNVEADVEDKQQLSSLNGANHPQKVLPPILLYIHKRRPQDQAFEYPAKQIIFSGKSIKDLFNQISAIFEIDQEYLRLFKYFPNNKTNPWRIIEEKAVVQKEAASDNIIIDLTGDDNDTTTVISSTTTNTIAEGTTSVASNNITILDGDQVITIDEKLITSSSSSSSSSTTTTTVVNSELIESKSIPSPPPPPPSKKKENTPSPIAELRGKPYLLKDGDIIAYLDTRDDPEFNDKFALAMPKSYGGGGSNNKSYYGSSFSSGSRNRTQEVDLKIELDDF